MGSQFINFIIEKDDRFHIYDCEVDDIDKAEWLVKKYFTSSPYHPFKFFNWFFTNEGLKSFVYYCNNGASYYRENITAMVFNEEEISWQIKFKDDENEIAQGTISFESELLLLFKEKFKECMVMIRDCIEGIFNSAELNTSIRKHHEKLLNIEIKDNDLSDTYLKIFTKYLEGLKMSSTTGLNSHLPKYSKKLAFDSTIRVPNLTPTINMGIKVNAKNIAIIKAFYNLDIDGEKFIDSKKTTEADFLKFFTEELAFPPQYKIFCSSSLEATQCYHIIRALKRIFFSSLASFSYKKIGLSEIFINPNGKPMNGNDISTSTKNCKNKHEIDFEIDIINQAKCRKN